eukprot:GHVS01025796.1.p1 GENE.GHVS01025796.1~~GHVS01025796.1.p1  ORF type:complete len:284 (-),score=65.69 GHVS01025796.1:204-1055(-)
MVSSAMRPLSQLLVHLCNRTVSGGMALSVVLTHIGHPHYALCQPLSANAMPLQLLTVRTAKTPIGTTTTYENNNNNNESISGGGVVYCVFHAHTQYRLFHPPLDADEEMIQNGLIDLIPNRNSNNNNKHNNNNSRACCDDDNNNNLVSLVDVHFIGSLNISCLVNSVEWTQTLCDFINQQQYQNRGGGQLPDASSSVSVINENKDTTIIMARSECQNLIPITNKQEEEETGVGSGGCKEQRSKETTTKVVVGEDLIEDIKLNYKLIIKVKVAEDISKAEGYLV